MSEHDRSRRSGVALEKCYRFLLWLIPTVEKFPKSQKFLLGDRIQTLALDVQESLIEATYAKNPGAHLLACNLTSQWFANIYLDPFDHYVKEVLRMPYVRYVDDFALFADTPEQLAQCRRASADFLARRRLRLHPSKTFIVPTTESAEFLGYVLLADGRRRLPEANVRRFRNRLRGLRDRWRAGTVAENEVRQRIGSWIAHAGHADTRCLRRALFAGGWFDPGQTDLPEA